MRNNTHRYASLPSPAASGSVQLNQQTLVPAQTNFRLIPGDPPSSGSRRQTSTVISQQQTRELSWSVSSSCISWLLSVRCSNFLFIKKNINTRYNVYNTWLYWTTVITILSLSTALRCIYCKYVQYTFINTMNTIVWLDNRPHDIIRTVVTIAGTHRYCHIDIHC